MLPVVVLAVATALGLTACSSNVGLAASVNSHHLTNSDLRSLVRPGATPFRDQQNGTTVYPQPSAVELWIQTQVVSDAVTLRGGPAGTSELNLARRAVLGNTPMATVVQDAARQGFTAAFASLEVDEEAYLVLLAQRLLGHGATAAQAVAALNSGQIGQQVLLNAITTSRPQVTVSSRYGVWQPRQFTLKTGPGVGVPAFVQLPNG